MLRLTALLRRGRVLIQAVGISAALAGLNLLGQVVLLRTLPLAEAGQLALLLSLSAGLALGGALGQPTFELRRHSRAPSGLLDWPYDMGQIALLTVPVCCAATVLLTLIYRLDSATSIYLVTAALLAIRVAYAASLLSAQRMYATANALLRLPASGLALIGAASLAWPGLAHLATILLWQLATLATTNLLGSYFLRVRIEPGPTRITLRERLAGLNLLAMQSSTLFLDQGVLAIAGLVLGAPSIAPYAALATLLAPLQLIWSVLTMMLVRETADQTHGHDRELIGGVWALSLGLGVAFALSLPLLLNVLYQGRFGEAAPLAPLLAFVATCKLVESLPRSMIVSRAELPLLRRFTHAQLVITATGSILVGGLALSFGLVGVAWGAATVAGARGLVSSILAARLTNALSPNSQPEAL